MKKTLKLFRNVTAGIKIMIFAVAIVSSNGVYAQVKQSITGKLIEEKSNQVVSFATVALIKGSDSKIAGGSMSDENGVFSISSVIPGNYILKVSSIGFKPVTKTIAVENNLLTDAGIILLQDTSIMLEELVIVGERIKAKSESDRTTFNVTTKMLDVSSSGTDVLKLIPGVQIDLMQNISLEGSRDILIYVDGKERDKRYVSQLRPDQIDKIEVISAPPSDYDGNVTGAINIVLKKDKDSGFNGHVLAEIPTTSSLVYAFPSYSLNWGLKKLNFYTSYNGELTYLDLRESTIRSIWSENDTSVFTINQDLKQKEWTNRFHYGFDYFLSERDQFNFYGYYSNASRELDGFVYSPVSGATNECVSSMKEDADKSTGTFYSLYYKHNFNKKGRELTADISNYFLSAENRTNFDFGANDIDLNSRVFGAKPKQNAFILRIDYKALLQSKYIFSAGVKAKHLESQDKINNYKYNESIYAIYGNLSLKQTKTDLSIGLRLEQSESELIDAFSNPFLTFLPNATVRYKLTTKQNIQASLNSTIKRPNIFQLNPYSFLGDPYTICKGNPFLKPELTSSLFLEHSIQFNGNYLASRIFLNRTNNFINRLLLINEINPFEIQVQNLGSGKSVWFTVFRNHESRDRNTQSIS